MKYQSENIVSRKLFENIEEVTKERVVKDMIKDIIEGMSLEDMETLFHITVLDPETDESRRIMAGMDIDEDHVAGLLSRLKMERQILFNVDVTII